MFQFQFQTQTNIKPQKPIFQKNNQKNILRL